MDIGISAPLATPFATPEFVHVFGVATDERGFHSLWLAEHVVLFDDYRSRYPYAEDGKITLPGEMGLLDPFEALTFLGYVNMTLFEVAQEEGPPSSRTIRTGAI